jgi:O-antigen/teichoic acid export membrane protein
MFGDGFEAGYLPLVILAAGVFARVAAGPAEDMLNMTGNGAASASTYLAIIVVNVALAIPMIAAFGLNGAAIASAVALALRAFWLARSARTRLGVETSIITSIFFRDMIGARRVEQAPAE